MRLKKLLQTKKAFVKRLRMLYEMKFAEKAISSRNIEMYCSSKWKRKTKPKNEERSFFQDENHNKRIMIDTQGMLVKEISVTSHSKADNEKRLKCWLL